MDVAEPFPETEEAVVGCARVARQDGDEAPDGFTTIGAMASSIAGLSAGHLDVATLPTLAQWPATPLVAAFRREHPAIRVHILGPSEPRTAELAKMIRRGVCEIGLTESHAFTEGLVETSLGSHDYVAVMPPQTETARGGSVSYEDVLAMGIIRWPLVGDVPAVSVHSRALPGPSRRGSGHQNRPPRDICPSCSGWCRGGFSTAICWGDGGGGRCSHRRTDAIHHS
jgi:DNA-binding transcriptional LysR family regulator